MDQVNLNSSEETPIQPQPGDQYDELGILIFDPNLPGDVEANQGTQDPLQPEVNSGVPPATSEASLSGSHDESTPVPPGGNEGVVPVPGQGTEEKTESMEVNGEDNATMKQVSGMLPFKKQNMAWNMSL